MLPAILTTILWSGCVIAARRSVEQLGENQANLARIVLAFMVLGLLAHLFGNGLGGAGLWFFILSGIVGFGLGDIGIFYALPRIGSRLTLLMAQCVAAPIAGLLEWWWMGTIITSLQIFAILLILGGIVLAIAPKKLSVGPSKRFVAGILFGLMAAIGQGAGAVLSRKGYAACGELGLDGESSILASILLGATTGYQRLLGGTLVILVFFVLGYVIRSWRSYPNPEAAMAPFSSKVKFVVLNAAAGPIFGIIFFQWALATTPSALVQPIVAMTPIVVMPMAWWWEGDRPPMRSILGALLSVLGVVLLAFA